MGVLQMSTKRVLVLFTSVIVGIVACIAVLTSWYTVDESEQAVVITFGEATEIIPDSGLHFKLPWPVQKVEKLSKETFSLQFGYTQENNDITSTSTHETKMITGDDQIVLTDLVVQWKIIDPTKFLFNADNPQEILHSATSSAIRSVIGNSKIDEALTSGKAEIEGNTRELLVTLIEKYDIGIGILAVKLQDVELPNAEVRAAFTAVTDARETKSTKENEALKYKNKRLQEAAGERDAILSEARGQKTARVEQALGEVAVFNKLYEQYSLNQVITKERLVIETLETVLPGAHIYIMNDKGDTLKYLPLQQTPSQIPVQSSNGGGQ